MLLASIAAAAALTSQSSSFVITSEIPSLGGASGPIERLRAGRFDLHDETPDLLTLQGSHVEFLMNPSVPTPNWLTIVSQDVANDLAVLRDAAAPGRDVALSIGATGLVRHDWNPGPAGAFTETVLCGGAWSGGVFLEAFQDGPDHVIVGTNALGDQLLRARLTDETLVELPPIAIPIGVVDAEGIDWGNDGTLDLVIQIEGLGFYVLDSLGEVIGTFRTEGIDERMVVSRSTVPGEGDLLFVCAMEHTQGQYLLLGGNSGTYTNAVLWGDVGACDLAALDIDGDGREDIVVLESNPTEGSLAFTSQAKVHRRSGAFSLTGLQQTIETITVTPGTTGQRPISVAVDVADFDNDGDEDLAFLSADGSSLRIWHSDVVVQDSQFVRAVGELVGTVDESSMTVDMTLARPDAFDSADPLNRVGDADSLLVEVWRMRDFEASAVFDTEAHVAQFHPHGFETTGGQLDLQLVLQAAPGESLDTHAFRIDLTMVRTEGEDVVERYMTRPYWYASTPALRSAIRGVVQGWPHLLMLDPENTTGQISGSGSSTGTGPPSGIRGAGTSGGSSSTSSGSSSGSSGTGG
ncbi:MAG: VCBS repeat-containing protein [Planctomycetota bacterium]